MTFFRALQNRSAVLLAFALSLSLASIAGPLAAQTATADPAAPATPIEIVDYGLGPADAKVKIIEYASFTCPHCATFHANVFPQLKKDYIDTGKIRFEYREVYFDRFGLWAAMIARCGGEMRYFGIVGMVFEQQQAWTQGEPQAVADNLKKIGRTAGLDDAAMDQCLNNKPMAEAMIAHYQANFAADKIEGTPTFMINGVQHRNMAYEDMKIIIETELAK